MRIADKMITVAENEEKVFDAGYEKGLDVARSIINKSIIELSDDNITEIGIYAFIRCTSMTKVCLPSLKTIASYGFAGCMNLLVADLGNVSSIGSNAFENCWYLEKLILRNTAAVASLANTNCFTATAYVTTAYDAYVYVPEALLDDYQQDEIWSSLSCEILPIEGSEFE